MKYARALLIDGNTQERLPSYDKAQRGFVIVNEELLRELDRIADFAHELVILDEAQRIKNHTKKSAVNVKALPVRRRRVGARNLETLRQRIDHCVVRRVRQDVLDQLPSRMDTRVEGPFAPKSLERRNLVQTLVPDQGRKVVIFSQ